MSASRLIGGLVLTGSLAATLSPALARPSTPSTPSTPALNSSHLLWATVDVCNPKDKPHTVGIRGSMPSDGRSTDIMYMRLRVQFLDPSTKVWSDLSKGGDSGYLKLGAGTLARQGGLSVQLAPGAGTSSFTLRGYVNFQWRRAGKIVHSAVRATSAGHTSAAGADPRGYSAATCKLS